MSFHESLMRTKFLMGCIASAILPFLLLLMPGVDRWRVIPAFIFSGILFWIYFRTISRHDEESAGGRDLDPQLAEPTTLGPLSEPHPFLPLRKVNPKEAEKALIESCIAEELSERRWIYIHLQRPLPNLAVWQAALDRLQCGVRLHNTCRIEQDSIAVLHAGFDGREYSFEAEYFKLQEFLGMSPQGFAADDVCVRIGASQTETRQWACLLFLAASLANAVNSLILANENDDDAPVTIDSAALVERARMLVIAKFPESVFPRSHWSGPETILD